MDKPKLRKNHDAEIIKEVGAKSRRKLRARQRDARTAWLGLSVMGLVGWSVAIPTLCGILLGIWIDRTYPSRFSWTLMLLVIGLLIGCLNIWYWLGKEMKEIKDDDPDHPKKGQSEDAEGKEHHNHE